MDKHELIQERCPASGKRSIKEHDQNRQQCPACGQVVWITPGGYFTAHNRSKRG